MTMEVSAAKSRSNLTTYVGVWTKRRKKYDPRSCSMEE
jgi:hypothetical protein